MLPKSMQLLTEQFEKKKKRKRNTFLIIARYCQNIDIIIHFGNILNLV